MSNADSGPPLMNNTNCGGGGGSTDLLGLRIASIFIIMTTSMSGAFFPVLARRTKCLNVPKSVFDFAKYFGSGVIIATAFIHLLGPAIEALTSPCLTGVWTVYPWAVAIPMLSMFILFFVELFAFRWGSAFLARRGITYDAHGHDLTGGPAHAAHGPETPVERNNDVLSAIEKGHTHSHAPNHAAIDSAAAQVIGILILEFGIVFHSVLIGLTLAVDDNFKVLFVVLVFHQMFEGLGLGSRLAFMQLGPKYRWIPPVGALLYGLTTPIGIAAGLGVRSTYNPESMTASIVSGIFDSLSAGILLYTGLVELLAHEFLFNREMSAAPTSHVAYACGCMITGAGLMSLLGRWA